MNRLPLLPQYPPREMPLSLWRLLSRRLPSLRALCRPPLRRLAPRLRQLRPTRLFRKTCPRFPQRQWPLHLPSRWRLHLSHL